MSLPTPDLRSPRRRDLDEQIATEAPLDPPDLVPDATAAPVEEWLAKRRPVALIGVVENGMIRPLDPSVNLPEQMRVIIIAAGS